MRYGFLFFILIIFISCKTKFRYESTIEKKNECYLANFIATKSLTNDSLVKVEGKAFLKRKNHLRTIESYKIILLDKHNNQVVNQITGITGFNFYIKEGCYRLYINDGIYNRIEIDSISITSGNHYYLDFYLKKGSRTYKWIID